MAMSDSPKGGRSRKTTTNHIARYTIAELYQDTARNAGLDAKCVQESDHRIVANREVGRLRVVDRQRIDFDLSFGKALLTGNFLLLCRGLAHST
jgi:hypothetical protein